MNPIGVIFDHLTFGIITSLRMKRVSSTILWFFALKCKTGCVKSKMLHCLLVQCNERQLKKDLLFALQARVNRALIISQT